ncbi:MAG: sialidase family protein, partial [bacterium]
TWSDDEGDTWDFNPAGCTATVNDHQTVFAGAPVTSMTVGYPNVIYLCNNSVAHNSCIKSIDGARTFAPTGTPAQLGVVPGETGVMGTPFCGGLHGHGITGPDGSIYIGKGACGKPHVLISRDEGLTWDAIVVADTVTTTHDVDLAMDSAGTLYGVWTGEDERVYMSQSADQGATWSPPMLVSAPELGSTFMPVIAAGDPGHVAIGYNGTADGEGSPADVDEGTDWYPFLTVSMTADTDAPVLATTRGGTREQPVHVGPCIDRCGAFVDFIDIVIGPDGMPYMASASCLDKCEDASEVTNGSLEGGVLVTLTSGPVLKTMDASMEHDH